MALVEENLAVLADIARSNRLTLNLVVFWKHVIFQASSLRPIAIVPCTRSQIGATKSGRFANGTNHMYVHTHALIQRRMGLFILREVIAWRALCV